MEKINFRNLGSTFRPYTREDANKQGKPIYDCEKCGSAVINPQKHQEWHDKVVLANETREENERRMQT